MNSIEIQLDPKDFKDTEPLLLDVEEGQLWINTVCNINSEGILPARFLRGFLPAFKLAEDVRDRSDGQINPTIRVFQPKHFSMLIDEIAQKTADQQQSLALTTILAMTQKHFPFTKVRFETDQRIENETEETLLEVASLVNTEQNQELISRLKQSGRKWGGESGENKSLIYAAHHPFGWSNLHHPAFFETRLLGTVINVLPPSEKRFTLIRKQIQDVIGNTPLARLVRSGITLDRTMNICGAHYISVTDETGKKLEPDLASSWQTSCGDIIGKIQDELLNLKSGSVKSNLKKAVSDLQILMEDLSEENIIDIKDILFCDLVGGVK